MKFFKQQETYVSDQVKFCGDIESDSDISLDGRMTGNIVSKKHVMLGATASFEGTIHCDSALICGHLDGTVVAKRLIEVKIPAQITGDLIADSVRVDSGVAFQGKICAKNIQPDAASRSLAAGTVPNDMPESVPEASVAADSLSGEESLYAGEVYVCEVERADTSVK